MEEHSFDTHGLFFVIKTLCLLALLGTGVHFGIDYFETHEYTPILSIEERAEASTTPHQENHFIAKATIEEHVPQTGKFIGADLNEMKLYTYENGALVSTYTILSKGRPGSQWETPTGSYEILYKNENHFSSIGDVYMPYSMQFFGNFFIHGWPYYPDGTPVDEGFSGGCIRLSTEDAQAIYEFGETKTPLFVYDSSYTQVDENKDIQINKEVTPPLTSADAYLVADLETGEVFLEKNINKERAVASLTKLMTAVVANETISYAKKIEITQNALNTHGEQGNLRLGEHMTLNDLLYPLLLESSNDAATAISDFLGSHYFISLMNRKAYALTMKKTRYADSSGLSPENISTASDLFKLVQYIYEKKKYIFDITTQNQKTIFLENSQIYQTYTNNNPLFTRNDFVGGKNGYTEKAGNTLITVFNMPYKGSTRPIVVIVLGSENHAGETVSLYGWLQRSIES